MRASDETPERLQGYVLYPGDLLQVTVFDHPDLTTQLRVPDQGGVTFPLIGEIEGLPGSALESVIAQIARRLEDGYVRQAVVSATVSAFAPRHVCVMGAVHHQGAIDIDPLSTTTVLQAIGLAGGLSDDADHSTVTLLRDDAGGGKTALTIRLDDEGSHLTKPNDLIVVQHLDRAYIIGQVAKPGSVVLSQEDPLTVSKAISAAGGFDRFAKQSRVQLLRPGEPSRSVDVRAILAGKKGNQDDLRLKPGDTVFVPESRF